MYNHVLHYVQLLFWNFIRLNHMSSPHRTHNTLIHQPIYIKCTQYSWKHLCRVTASLSKCTVWQNVFTFVHHVTHSHRHCKASVPLKSFQVILTVRQDVFSPFVQLLLRYRWWVVLSLGSSIPPIFALQSQGRLLACGQFIKSVT